MTDAARNMSPHQMKYLSLLSEKHPTVQSLYAEISSLQAMMGLPKGTEHFMSDLHGEYEAFEHILNNCSGVIKEKATLLYQKYMSQEEIEELCTVIYYPQQKIRLLEKQGVVDSFWYRRTLINLIRLARLLSSKYTRQEVRRAIPDDYDFVLDELMHSQEDEDKNQHAYHEKIVDTLVEIGAEKEFIRALSGLIKNLAVARLHVLGDLFDRGGAPDKILDMLMRHPAVDFTWGNHDILWMGAAAGCQACIMATVRNTLNYGHLRLLESSYGISMRPLYALAQQNYPSLSPDEAALKTITIMMFKLEGQLIQRHPEFMMDDKLLLDKIDTKTARVTKDGTVWPLIYQQFPTLVGEDYYQLTPGESQVAKQLSDAFEKSDKLHRHVRFLYDHGSVYKRHNGNLLFHGCIPLTEEGALKDIAFHGQSYRGRAYLDYCDQRARAAYRNRQQKDTDFMWFLWCGDVSPLCGRKMSTFAHMMIADRAAFSEPRDPYYTFNKTEEGCEMMLAAFDLNPKEGRIINGHTPVLKGESPLRAGGRIIVIDGGFCTAYQKRTGIAGYTLISNSHGMRIVAHDPFAGVQDAVESNSDIVSTQTENLPFSKRQMVADTDEGQRLKERVADLKLLLHAYREGIFTSKYEADEEQGEY